MSLCELRENGQDPVGSSAVSALTKHSECGRIFFSSLAPFPLKCVNHDTFPPRAGHRRCGDRCGRRRDTILHSVTVH